MIRVLVMGDPRPKAGALAGIYGLFWICDLNVTDSVRHMGYCEKMKIICRLLIAAVLTVATVIPPAYAAELQVAPGRQVARVAPAPMKTATPAPVKVAARFEPLPNAGRSGYSLVGVGFGF